MAQDNSVKHVYLTNCLGRIASTDIQESSFYNKIKDNIVTICQSYQNIMQSSGAIINDATLSNSFSIYADKLKEIQANDLDIRKQIKMIEELITVPEDLSNNLNFILKQALLKENKAKNIWFMAQQDATQIGSFLIGSIGYIRKLGEDLYLQRLDVTTAEQELKPIKLKIIPPYNKFETFQPNTRCTRGQPVSFIIPRTDDDLLLQKGSVLAAVGDYLVIQDVNQLPQDYETLFCIDKAGDGFRIEIPGDIFVNKTADKLTRDITQAGTFTFTAEIEEIDFSRSRMRGDFRVGRHGYLKHVENNEPIEQYLRFKPIINGYMIVDHLRFKIIEPLLTEVDERVCHKDLLMSLELEWEGASELDRTILSYKGRTLFAKDFSRIRTDLDKQYSTFCLEQKDGYFRIKNLSGWYIDNHLKKSAIDNSVNMLVNTTKDAGLFDFVPTYGKQASLGQGEVGGFIFDNTGYIKSENAGSTSNTYLTTRVLEDIDYNSPEELLTGKVVEPVQFKVVPPKRVNTKGVCSEHDVAVSFEFVHNPDLLLGYDEWQFEKYNKFKPDIADLTTFCIEQVGEAYRIKSVNDSYFEMNLTGLTKNPDYYGSFSFADHLDPIKEISHIDLGLFKDGTIGYIKSSQNDLFLNIKDINNNHFNLHKIEIEELDYKTKKELNVCNDEGVGAISIINNKNEVLTNLYGKPYFINRNTELADTMPIFCVKALEGSYVLYSDFRPENKLFLSKTANYFVDSLDFAGKFTLVTELPQSRMQSSYRQGDVGMFKFNSVGYLKLKDKNLYLNVRQHDGRYNDMTGIPLKFKIIPPLYSTPSWCQDGMAVSFEDAYYPNKILGYVAVNNLMDTTTELKLYNKSDFVQINLRELAVFCLEHSQTGNHYKLSTKGGFYLDDVTAMKMTKDPTARAEILLYDRPLNTGTDDHASISQANGLVLVYQDAVAKNFYLNTQKITNVQSITQFIDAPAQATGFTLVPGLSDNYCVSLKESTSDRFLLAGDSVTLVAANIISDKAKATFCPVFNPIEQRLMLRLYNSPDQYLVSNNSRLEVGMSNQVPVNNPQFLFRLANKRELTIERQKVSQAITNLNCENLALNGTKVGTTNRSYSGACPTLQSFHDQIGKSLAFNDFHDSCCTNYVYLYATSATPVLNGGCEVSFDLICTDDY